MGNIYMGLDYTMSRYFYPTLPDYATKDYYEMIDPLDLVEMNCRCNHDDDGKLIECDSCKQYFESKRVQSVIGE